MLNGNRERMDGRSALSAILGGCNKPGRLFILCLAKGR